MRVVVIGAGPAGLVTLKTLLSSHKHLGTEPIEVSLFERESGVGGTFLSRTYEDAELVSSKQLTTFSDFRVSDDEPDFLSAKRYVQYLNDYCNHFNLWPYIHLSTTVQSITRGPGGAGHIVSYLQRGTKNLVSCECDAIAVCSGLHVEANLPAIPGIDRVPIVIHSSEFKTRSQFGKDKTVVVIGSGETGSDISYLAVTSPTKRVVLCHRDGFHFAPKRNLDPSILPILRKSRPKRPTIPLDTGRASLFDTAYVHPLLRNHSVLWTFYDIYVRSILWITAGSSAGLDQWIGGPSPERNHVSKLFFNKSNNSYSYISAPYREEGMSTITQRIRSALIQTPIPDTRGRQIDLAPWPDRIDKDGMIHFRNNQRPEYERMKNEAIKPDVVVLCTGYRQEFPFFSRKSPGHPYPTAHEANVRSIWNHEDSTVGFIGFVRPSLGAIPPLAEMQAQLWVLNLLAPQRIPRPLMPMDEQHYRLLVSEDARVQYGVDHESYVYQLALDMDSALGFWEVVRLGWQRRAAGGWKLPLVWALACNMNTKFRARGSWKWDGALEVMETEIWGLICRRRWFYDHFLLSVLPMSIFGPLSLAIYIYTALLDNLPLLAVLTTRS